MTDSAHIPVLVDEVLDLLNPAPGDVAVDCTLGRAGHAEAIARRVGETGMLIGFDLDPENIAFSTPRLEATGTPVHLIRASFVAIGEQMRQLSLRADVILADLGFSSSQMDDPERGFSFRRDGPLDMRLDPDGPITAADILATRDERELADLIFQYGEDPYARKIARKLVESRRVEPIRTTAQLAALVVEAYGPRARRSRMHPATRTFMALRIAVNDELGSLRLLLDQIIAAAQRVSEGDAWLRAGARVGLISFQSLEDRMVKQTFVDIERRGIGRRLTKKPVTASPDEASANPRARSAKLRVVRIDGPSPQ